MRAGESPALALKNRIDGTIRLYRGQRVILDMDIANLYGVPVAQLNQAVKRNRARFPRDFMFQVTKEEITAHRSMDDDANLKSQSVISSARWGGRRSLPYAFTEEGVAMLSSVLRSPRAIHVNIEIMRAFVRLRGMLGVHADLARKIEALEQKYDRQFKGVFDAIRRLMTPVAAKGRPIGFQPLPGEPPGRGRLRSHARQNRSDQRPPTARCRRRPSR